VALSTGECAVVAVAVAVAVAADGVGDVRFRKTPPGKRLKIINGTRAQQLNPNKAFFFFDAKI